MSKRIFIFLTILSMSLSSRAQTRYEIPFAKPLMAFSDTVTFAFIGDVMMHTRQLQHDPELFLKRISPFLSQADFAVANMEFCLGGAPYTGYPAFSTPDDFPSHIADSGVDIFLTANNHILDRGSRGLSRTLDIYRRMDGIRFTGTSATPEEDESNYPLVIRCKGITVALLNFTYGTNASPSSSLPKVNLADTTDIRAAIRRAECQGADFIIALPHWGNEYELHHSPSQERLARWLADAGADAVIGTHPHVVQDSTHIKGVPVIYSIGNAVSNMSARNTRLELAVSITFVRDQIQDSVKMMEPELAFMWCTLPGNLTDGFCTIFTDEWKGRREEWINPSDYDNMIRTLESVKTQTGIRQ